MRIVLLSALFVTSVFAQHRGAAAPVGRVSAPPPVNARPTAPARPPAPVRPVNPARPFVPRLPRTIAVPYPVFIGGGYSGGYPYDNGYSSPTPIAVVNQNFQTDSVNPSIIDFSNVPLPDAIAPAEDSPLRDDEPTIFLIALTDHTVVAAIAYWADGDTLHWVSRDAKPNQMSLSLVDRDFSKQLNDERHVEFKLPAAN
jgi:hypothetical protein